MIHFTLNAQTGELPANTALAIDETQRTLVQGEIFAFCDPDGDRYFIARIDEVGRATKAVVGRDKCTVIGRVVAWAPVLH